MLGHQVCMIMHELVQSLWEQNWSLAELEPIAMWLCLCMLPQSAIKHAVRMYGLLPG